MLNKLNALNILKDLLILIKFCVVQASYWSGKRHEIYGQIFNQDNKVVHNLFGKWNEAIYCGASAPSARCIWRPGKVMFIVFTIFIHVYGIAIFKNCYACLCL